MSYVTKHINSDKYKTAEQADKKCKKVDKDFFRKMILLELFVLNLILLDFWSNKICLLALQTTSDHYSEKCFCSAALAKSTVVQEHKQQLSLEKWLNRK